MTSAPLWLELCFVPNKAIPATANEFFRRCEKESLKQTDTNAIKCPPRTVYIIQCQYHSASSRLPLTYRTYSPTRNEDTACKNIEYHLSNFDLIYFSCKTFTFACCESAKVKPDVIVHTAVRMPSYAATYGYIWGHMIFTCNVSDVLFDVS